jgi:hypothetical protein
MILPDRKYDLSRERREKGCLAYGPQATCTSEAAVYSVVSLALAIMGESFLGSREWHVGQEDP